METAAVAPVGPVGSVVARLGLTWRLGEDRREASQSEISSGWT